MRRLHSRQIAVVIAGLVLAATVVWQMGEGIAPQDEMAMRVVDNRAVADIAGDGQETDSVITTAGDGQEIDSVVTVAESRADEPSKLTGEVVRGFGWLEEDGVWRYHTGVDIRYEGIVPSPADATVTLVEAVAGGYRVELTREGEMHQYEPLTDVTCAVGDTVAKQATLGRVAGILHIAYKRDGKWIPWQNQP